MKKYKNTEDLFKSKLSNYEQNPPADLWARIENDLPKNQLPKKSGKLKFIISGGLLIIAGIAAFFNINQNQTENQSYTAAISVPGKTDIIVKSSNPKTNKTTTAETTKRVASAKKSVKILNEKTIKTQQYTTAIKADSEVQKSETDILDNDIDIEKNKPQTESTSEKNAVPQFSADFSASQISGCAPLTVNFENKSVNIEKAEWDFGNGISTNVLNPLVTFETAGIYTVKLTAFNGGFSKVQTINIEVHESPVADFILDKSSRLYAGDEISFANMSDSRNTYSWDFGDGTKSSKAHPKHVYSRNGIYDISLTVTDPNGCKASCNKNSVIVIDDKYKILAPDAFKPNPYGANSGMWQNAADKNEIFFPILQMNVSEYRLRIFNRRGVLVFETNDYQIGWNGYYRGELATYDAYIWECYGKFEDGEPFYQNGNITMVR